MIRISVGLEEIEDLWGEFLVGLEDVKSFQMAGRGAGGGAGAGGGGGGGGGDWEEEQGEQD